MKKRLCMTFIFVGFVLLVVCLGGCRNKETENLSKPQEDSSKPPAVGLQTIEEESVICTYATLGTYEWEVDKGFGMKENVIACGSAPTEWEIIATIRMEKTDGTIKLIFSDDMQEYSISYWTKDATCGVADGVTMEGDTVLLKGEEAKGIYELHVTYPNGNAYYGFNVE